MLSWAGAAPAHVPWGAATQFQPAGGGAVTQLAESLAATSLEDGCASSNGRGEVAPGGMPRSPGARPPMLPPLEAGARPNFLEPAPRMRPRTSPSMLSVTPPRGGGGGGGVHSGHFSVGTARRGSRRSGRFSGLSPLPRLGRRTPPRRSSPAGRGAQRATPPGSRAELHVLEVVPYPESASPFSPLRSGGWTPRAPDASPSLPLRSHAGARPGPRFGATGGPVAGSVDRAVRPASAAQLAAVDEAWPRAPSVAGLPAVGVTSSSTSSSSVFSPSARGTVPGPGGSTDSMSPPDIPRAGMAVAASPFGAAADARAGVRWTAQAAGPRLVSAMAMGEPTGAGAGAASAVARVSVAAGDGDGTEGAQVERRPTSATGGLVIDPGAPWRVRRPGGEAHGHMLPRAPPRRAAPVPASSPSLGRRRRRWRGRGLGHVPPSPAAPADTLVARGAVEEEEEAGESEEGAGGADVRVRPAPSRARSMCIE